MTSIDPQGLLAAIQVVHDRFVADRDDTARVEVLRAALEGAIALTDSAMGFIARIRSTPAGSVLTPECIHAVDQKRHGKVIDWLWKTLESGARGETIPRPLANLARTTEPVLLDYEPRLPALDNFMAIPLSRHGRRWQPIAVLAVANRSGGYEPAFVEALAPLLSACGTLLKAYEDADERAVREAELERSEQRFRTFMDASPCIAYITDPERTVVWASRAFGQQFQLDVEDAIGRNEDELLPGGMAARTRAIHDQARVADGFIDMLEPIVDGTGVVHWWQGAKFPIDGAGGERLVGSLALDVSDNVRMTEVLRERETALAESQTLAHLGRWSLVLETNKLTWDEHFEGLCRRPSPEAAGIEALLELVHPDDIEPTRRALDQLLDEGDRVGFEQRLLVDGELRELHVVVRVRREIEEGPVLLAVCQDVSEQRRLERSRHELENKAHKFESLAVLVGGMAQEFNALLVSILGNAGIALDDLDHDSLAAACVQDIEASAERATLLTQQMLSFSGRSSFVYEELDLSALISSLASSLHDTVSDLVSVRLTLPPDLPEILGDRRQLRQLVMNLVINGSEAIGEAAGELSVTTGVDDFDSAQLAKLIERSEFGSELGPGRYVWLAVRDTGSGMDEATRARIFEPFFSTKLAGRGLGLAAVLGVTRSHGGGILVESAPGAGSSFEILLPPAHPSEGGVGESWSHTVSGADTHDDS